MTAAACTVSGCGSSGAAYLDTSTARTAGWVEVRTSGIPAAARWFCTGLCAALTLGGAEIEVAVRTRLAADLDAAAARLAKNRDLDLSLLLDRIRGVETARRLVEPDRRDDGEARCHLCGCTEDDACAGGCAWAPGDGMHDTCTACAPADACDSAGCGLAAEDVDGSDPALWGWICLQVGGTEAPLRWVCSPWCAAAAIAAGGAELAAQETASAAGRGAGR